MHVHVCSNSLGRVARRVDFMVIAIFMGGRHIFMFLFLFYFFHLFIYVSVHQTLKLRACECVLQKRKYLYITQQLQFIIIKYAENEKKAYN